MTESPASAVYLVFTTLPDAAAAEALAETVVRGGLAACVSVMAQCRSVYRWQGKVERSAEIPVMIKTTAARYAQLEAEIRRLHSYELPEVVAVPVAEGLPEYLDWVVRETA